MLILAMLASKYTWPNLELQANYAKDYQAYTKLGIIPQKIAKSSKLILVCPYFLLSGISAIRGG